VSTSTPTPAANGAARRPSTSQPPSVAVQPAPFRPQRKPRHLAAAVLLMGLGALGVFFAVDAATETTTVVEVRADVERGQTITREDLTTVEVNAPGVQTVPASKLNDLIGQRAAQPLLAGSLLAPAALAQTVVPAQGQTLVGVALTSAQMPAEPLQPGDKVSIVDTPAQGDANAAVSDNPNATPATVQTVGPLNTQGQTTVDVLVPENAAARLAAQASTGQVALVLQSRER
jgi:hypothetical protein